MVTWFVADETVSQLAPVDVVKPTAVELVVCSSTVVETEAPTAAVIELVPVRVDGVGTSVAPLLPLVLYWTVNATALTPAGSVGISVTDAL